MQPIILEWWLQLQFVRLEVWNEGRVIGRAIQTFHQQRNPDCIWWRWAANHVKKERMICTTEHVWMGVKWPICLHCNFSCAFDVLCLLSIYLVHCCCFFHGWAKELFMHHQLAGWSWCLQTRATLNVQFLGWFAVKVAWLKLKYNNTQ